MVEIKGNPPHTIAKLLRAIAGGTEAKAMKHDVIFTAAADLLDKQPVLLEKYPLIWCPTCEDIKSCTADEMEADAANNRNALDLVCDECKLIVSTLHSPPVR